MYLWYPDTKFSTGTTEGTISLLLNVDLLNLLPVVLQSDRLLHDAHAHEWYKIDRRFNALQNTHVKNT